MLLLLLFYYYYIIYSHFIIRISKNVLKEWICPFLKGFSAFTGAMQIWAEFRYKTTPNRHQTPNLFIFIIKFLSIYATFHDTRHIIVLTINSHNMYVSCVILYCIILNVLFILLNVLFFIIISTDKSNFN